MDKQQQVQDVLQALSHAKDAAAFRLHLTTYETKAKGIVVVRHETFHLLSSALARGLVLGTQQGSTALLQSAEVLDGISTLINDLNNVMNVLVGPERRASSRSSAAAQLAQLLAKSGLPPALAGFCHAAAAALQETAGQHEQSATAVMTLVPHVVDLLFTVMTWWPEKLLVDSGGQAVAVLPIAQLIVATCRRLAGRASAINTSGIAQPSSSSNISSTDGPAHTAACGVHLGRAWKAAAKFARVCCSEAFECSADAMFAAARSLLADPVMQDAAHIALAAAVSEMWALLRNSSTESTEQQQQQQQREHRIPPYHDQLWADLGCPSAGTALAAAAEGSPVSDLERSLDEAISAWLVTAQLYKLATPQKEAAVDEPEQSAIQHPQLQPMQQPQAQLTSLSRAGALFKVGLELLVLLPPAHDPPMMRPCMHAATVLLLNLAELMPEQEVGRLSGQLLHIALMLCTSVQQAVSSLFSGQARQPAEHDPRAAADVAEQIKDHLGLLVLLMADKCGFSYLESAVSADPLGTLSDLQTLLRHQASLLDAEEATDIMEMVLRAAGKITAVIPFIATGLSSPLREGRLQQTLLFVLLTCVKLANKCTADAVTSFLCFRLALAVLCAVHEIDITCEWQISSGSSGQHSNSSSSADDREGSSDRITSRYMVSSRSQCHSCLLLLAGRAVAAVGKGLGSMGFEHLVKIDPAANRGLIQCLQWLQSDLQHICGGQVAVCNQLQQQLLDLRQLLQAAAAGCRQQPGDIEQPEAGRSSMPSASAGEQQGVQFVLLTAEAPLKLQQLGEAVCASTPLPDCCNNPGCCNFSGESEQQLVHGKSCVCGGCQVARYCGRECQAAHWKQHKAACRRINKAKQGSRA